MWTMREKLLINYSLDACQQPNVFNLPLPSTLKQKAWNPVQHRKILMLCLLSLGPNTPENAKNKPYRILQDHVWEKYEFVRLNDWPISMHSLRKNSHQHMHNEMGAHRMTSALKVARNDQKSKWTLTLMSIYPTLMPRWQQHCASVEHVLVSES
jgi:hypothetical protein